MSFQTILPVTDPLGKTVTTTYTAADNVASIKDPNNNTSSYSYNGFGEQTNISSPDIGSTTMTYNEGGQVVTHTDARGKLAVYTYDVLGRVTVVNYYDGISGTVKTYDVGTNGVGRLITVQDSTGQTNYSYDFYGRVTSKTSYLAGIVRTVSYTRDSVGRVTSMTYPSGNVLGFTYAQSRVTNLTLNSSPLISAIQYFPLGGPESWLLGANTTGAAAYLRAIDTNSRIAQYSTPLGYRALTFDNGSRITAISNYQGSPTPSFNGAQILNYDNAGRLTAFNGYTSIGNQVQYFAYDNNGNRTGNNLNNAWSGYNYKAGNNRLVSIVGAISKTYTYDAAGNTTSDGTTSMTYDPRGRMTVAVNGGISTTYLINHQNLRVKKTNSQETKHFVYDDGGHMLGEYDAAGNTVQEMIWLGDTPVAVTGLMPCLTGGTCIETATAYVWSDHLNTPRELTRVNGSNQHISIWKWDSLPFGETSPNANPSNLGVMTFNHRFPGQYYDKETGLHQNWNREYDPKIGRYVESDPIGLAAGPNTYSYVRGDPIRLVDRQGLDALPDPTSFWRSFLRGLGGRLANSAN